MGDEIRVRFTKEKETLLATLYGRALDAKLQRPILGDAMAVEAVSKIDYDFARMKVKPALAASVAVRAKFFDRWVREFLAAHEAEHEQATVVHMGAGLDTRVWRIDPGPGVTWYDVDYPDVIELREKLYPARDGYQMIGTSVTEPGWEAQIPSSTAVLIVAEGLSMYLKREEGHELFRRLTDHFAHGTVAFDAFNRVGIRMQKLNAPVRESGSTLYWAVDDPHELEWAVPKLQLVEAVDALYAPGNEELPGTSRAMAMLVRPFPSMRHIAQYLRYEFS